MEKYIISYDIYDDILTLLGHEIPHSNLVNVRHVIVDLYEEEYEALVGAGLKIMKNYIPPPEEAILSYPAHISLTTSPLFTGGIMEYLNLIDSHTAGFDGTGVSIALMDTGCQDANAALANPTLIRQDYTSTGVTDLYNHGTKGVMIISQKLKNGTLEDIRVGMAYGCQLYSMNVFLGGTAAIIEATDYCIANNIDIINISLSMGYDLEDAMQAAIDAGIIVVVASGNSFVGEVTHPANVPGVIAVSCIDLTQAGDPVSGSYITEDDNTQICIVNYNFGHFEFYSGGTSQAAWMVSALLAIYKQKYPTLNTEKAIHLLRRRAIPMDGYTYDEVSPSKGKLINYETGGGFLAPLN